MPHWELFKKYKLHHLFFWLFVLGLWYYLRYEDYSSQERAFKISVVKTIDLAIMVYTTNYLLIPFLLYKKKYVWFVLAFILMIVTSSVIKMNIIGQILNNPELFSLKGNLKTRIYDNVIPHFFLVTAGAAFKLLLDNAANQRKLGELAKEKAETELNFLRSQINPHFLFNSLNTIYFQVDKNNTEARQTLLQFSDMLRYQLYDCNENKIPVEKELAYLQDYIKLQQLRKDSNYEISWKTSEGLKNFSITPLLLIPLVENAFKHISHNSDKPNFIKLDLARNNGRFIFSIENSKEDGIKSTEPKGGIGLSNVKRRLALEYPGKHELVIDDKTDTFKVNLQLTIEN